MKTLKVTIDRETKTISVYNDGQGIPVEMHATEGVWIPELIFGTLLTSSNYDDDEAKVTGGRNGYGAKLANIYSTEFVVETACSKNGKKYRQVFTNNMGTKGKPKVTDNSKGEDWTKVRSPRRVSARVKGSSDGELTFAPLARSLARSSTDHLHARPRSFQHDRVRRRHGVPPT